MDEKEDEQTVQSLADENLSTEEKEALSLARYKLFLAQFADDDPALAGQLLSQIDEIYAKRELPVPAAIQAQVRDAAADIRQALEKKMLVKRKEYSALQARMKSQGMLKKQQPDDDSLASRQFLDDEYLDYESSIQFLDRIQMQKGMKLGLANMTRALQLTDNPQLQYKVIHVTGTNGKGSVCAMLDAILTSAGHKVGRYISPHLVKINERIMINGREISDEKFAELVNYVRPYLRKVDLTYFEILTLMAFLHFRDEKVDFAVVEVGMGGRLDATNTAQPILSIITNIDFDHTKHLGGTIAEIATEKAGIIKENATVVTGCTGDALAVIKETCQAKRSKLVPLATHKVQRRILNIGDLKNVSLSLKGEFQHQNAKVAVTAAKAMQTMGIDLPDRSIKIGLASAEWPGRLDFIENNVLVDCAHNPAAINVLVIELKRLQSVFDRMVLVFGAMKDKDYQGMIEELCPLADKVFLTKVKEERAAEPEELAKEVKQYTKNFALTANVADAVELARSEAGPRDLVLITGSIYVVGDALKYLKGRQD
ncbi:bifunctional folylpolyglutamate synthase/dihydrofolate synthase [Candidatus Woesearchaeota archaeon]|nr:bifunctional folylpolyglutamate synthase/dihydrofolate synthase [Candidatus Woesearchaeota archaeon]